VRHGCTNFVHFRRPKVANRYKDFDQPSRTESSGSPYFGASQVPDIETFGVPVVQDPYADFVPKSSDEEDEDVAAENVRAPAAKRKCKEIGDLWGAQVARGGQQSQHGGNSRYGGETDPEYSGDFRNRGERRGNRRYNRPEAESSVDRHDRDRDRDRHDRNDRNSVRRRRRSSDIDEETKRRPSRHRRDETAVCDRGVSTSPQLSTDRFNERLLRDQSCGTTPVRYEDDGVQTDAVVETSSLSLPSSGGCRRLSFINDDLQKEYDGYECVCSIW
jgi:hypothetical protein